MAALTVLVVVEPSLFMASLAQHFKILSWNVRGLNSGAKQEDVKQVIKDYKPDIICLQETKMAYIDTTIIRNSLGEDYVDNFFYLPADGVRGGILLAAKAQVMTLSNPRLTENTISAIVTDHNRHVHWKLTGVYGP